MDEDVDEDLSDNDDAKLSDDEQYWCDHQPWLLSRGYQLRPRFRPDWVPSWVTLPVEHYGKMFDREDFIRHPGIAVIMDAIRLSDGKPVMMKRVYSRKQRVGYEHTISEYVSSPEQLQDPDHHCVPLLEVMQDPKNAKYVILVMPLLRMWNNPRFDTLGECLDFFLQAFKGIRYLHQNRIAHRDCTGNNLMMDGSELYPNGFHPVEQDYNQDFTGSAVQKYTRTQRPPRYYWIDFGLSVSFDHSVDSPRAAPMFAGDKTAPELQHVFVDPAPHEPIDPFPTDIYYLGNMIRRFFTEGSEHQWHARKFGFNFMKPLVETMVQDNPAERPTIEECVIQLEEIIQSRSSWTLRSQVWHTTDNPLGFIYRFFPHWARRVVYIITRTPAIPSLDRIPNVYIALSARVLLATWVIVTLLAWYFQDYTMIFLSLLVSSLKHLLNL